MSIKIIVSKIILAIGAFVYTVGFLWFLANESVLNIIVYIVVFVAHIIVIFYSKINAYCKISCVVLIGNYFYLFVDSLLESTKGIIWFDTFFPLLELSSVLYILYGVGHKRYRDD